MIHPGSFTTFDRRAKELLGGVGVGYRLGVDLGTTFTAAAVQRGGIVQMVQLGLQRPEIPSVVAVSNDEVVVGDAAERRALVDPSSIAREFKRRIGDPTPMIVNSTPWSAEALTGRVLSHVLEHVKAAEGEPPEAITLTHPANWHDYKLDHFRQAMLLAGCEDAELIAEPVAAALYYAAQGRVSIGQRLAVFDFGGGTLDTAIVEATNGNSFGLVGRPKGLERLGGVDLDHALFSHVLAAAEIDLDTLEDTQANRQALGRLRSDCREAKEYLSIDTSTAVPIGLPSAHTEVRINRTEFEAMIRPPLADATKVMEATIREAGLHTADIDGVLLVGGTSRIPVVSQIIGEHLQLPVLSDAHPKHSIASGATRTTDSINNRPINPAPPDQAATGAQPALSAPTPPIASTQPEQARPVYKSPAPATDSHHRTVAATPRLTTTPPLDRAPATPTHVPPASHRSTPSNDGKTVGPSRAVFITLIIAIGLAAILAVYLTNDTSGSKAPTTSTTVTPATADCVGLLEAADCAALTNLVNSPSGQIWGATLGWDLEVDPCLWNGIGCVSNQVFSVRVNDRGLSGEIPAELAQLRNLNYLDLARNELTGEIPAELGQLTNLIRVRLNSNQLSGEVPPEWNDLRELRVDPNLN